MFQYDGSGALDTNNIKAFLGKSALVGAGYAAISNTGILEMLPGYQQFNQSQSELAMSFATGAAEGLSREVARAFGLMGESSYLLTGQYGAYADEVAYNTILMYGLNRADIPIQLANQLSMLPSDFVIPASVGLLDEAGSLLRAYLYNMVQNSSSPTEHYLNYIIAPFTTLSGNTAAPAY